MHDIFTGKAAMPDQFFNPKTGDFNLPDRYRNPTPAPE